MSLRGFRFLTKTDPDTDANSIYLCVRSALTCPDPWLWKTQRGPSGRSALGAVCRGQSASHGELGRSAAPAATLIGEHVNSAANSSGLKGA